MEVRVPLKARVVAIAVVASALFASSASAVGIEENFDSLTPPTLPSGWTASHIGNNAVDWITSPTQPFNAPNGNFAPDPAGTDNCTDPIPASAVVDERLTTPGVILTASPVVIFQNNYDTENGNDGGVLEVSINGGGFTDIIAAGGVVVENGYPNTIATRFGSPIAGRPAWTGTSNGYVRTFIGMPFVHDGDSIQLRWRMAADCSVGGVGWRIDDLRLGHGPAAATSAATGVTGTAAVLNGSITSDIPSSYQFEYGLSAAYGSTTAAAPKTAANTPQAVTETLNGLAPATTYHYRALATNGIGAAHGDDQTFTTVAADADPPETTIDKVKVKADHGKAKFAFSASEAGSTFECKLDKAGFALCTSPQKYRHLDAGHHKFKVRATDGAGNLDPTPAKEKFKIDG
jgi:hypothetical protein